MMPSLHRMFGEDCWRLQSAQVELFVTRTGGHLAPVRFSLGDRTVEPLSIAPWHDEPMRKELPPMLRVLRGDFFCMPFGGSEAAFQGERHPPHGETANEIWHHEETSEHDGRTTLHLRLNTKIRTGRVDKYISLVEGHRAVYQRHVISGMSGPMTFGHHSMLKFPPGSRTGRISTHGFVHGQVAPEPVENPAHGGYSLLKPGAVFASLDAVPTITGQTTDVSRYPDRRGYEDLVMLVSDARSDFGWTAVAFSEEGYVWFALKNPRVLRNTVLWMSNAGRHYPPWNGRHADVMGVEEVTSYFHFGLDRSARPNALSKIGYATAMDLYPSAPLRIDYVFAVAPVPRTFDVVAAIERGDGGVVLTSASGITVDVPLHLDALA